MLGIEHRIDAAGLLLHALELLELGEGGHARLVGQHVLAMLHGGNGDRGPIGRNGRGQHHRYGGVFQDGARIADAPGLGISGGEGRREVVLDGVEGDELGAGILEAVNLAIDMAVIDADGGKLDVTHWSGVSRV
ncbi:hypothetical protein D3C72_2069630 [compost metagenome]